MGPGDLSSYPHKHTASALSYFAMSANLMILTADSADIKSIYLCCDHLSNGLLGVVRKKGKKDIDSKGD